MSAPWKGKQLSEEHRARIKAGVLAAKAAGKNVGGKGCKKPGSGALLGHAVSEEQRRKTSDTMTGQTYPSERGQAIADAFTPERRAQYAENKYDGGQIAEDFATILCPQGFVRGHVVWFGNKLDVLGRKAVHAAWILHISTDKLILN